MTCQRCHSEDIQRSRRKGIADKMRALAGWWPYRCEDCGRRFHARGRQVSPHNEARQETARPVGSEAMDQGPAMAFRSDSVKPQAKVVIAADSHEQLNEILLALDRAVSSYQRKSQHTNQDSRSYSAR